jgi:5-methylcytosine-specific restriction endonuclease McrA
MSHQPDIDAAIRFLDEVVEPYFEEQQRQSTTLDRDIPDGHIWREQRRKIRERFPPGGSEDLADQMRDRLLSDKEFLDGLKESDDGRLVPYIAMWENGHATTSSAGVVHKLFAHRICSLLTPVTQFPFQKPRPKTRKVVRKEVLVRDNAECAICGRGHRLPVNAYSQIRDSLGLKDDSKPERRQAQREHRRAYWLCTKPRLDHVIPARAGGPSAVWNLTVLCHICNDAKGVSFYAPLVRRAVERLRISKAKR